MLLMIPGCASHELRRGPLVVRTWSAGMPIGGDSIGWVFILKVVFRKEWCSIQRFCTVSKQIGGQRSHR